MVSYEAGDLKPVLDIEFLINVVDMVFNSVEWDKKFFFNIFGSFPFEEQQNDFTFSLSDVVFFEKVFQIPCFDSGQSHFSLVFFQVFSKVKQRRNIIAEMKDQK